MINPRTGQPFREDENPFIAGSSVDPTEARIKQGDFIASFRGEQKPTPSLDAPIVTNQPQLNEAIQKRLSVPSQAEPIGLTRTPAEETERQRLLGITEKNEEFTRKQKLEQDLGKGIFGGIEEKLGKARQEMGEARAAEKSQAATVAGAQAQGGGYSSAISGYIQEIDRKYNRRKEALEKAERDALESGNVALFDRVQQRLAQEDAEHERTMNRLIDQQTKAAELTKPTEVGGNLVRLNPTTGKYETVYTSPEKPKTAEEINKQAQNVVPTLFEELETTPSADFVKTVQKYAKSSGIDPLALSSVYLTYRDTKTKQDALSAKTNLDYLNSLVSTTGETITTNLPGVGEVTIKPKGDYQIIQTKGGGIVVYDKATGKQVRPGLLNSSQLTPSNVSDAISGIQRVAGQRATAGTPMTEYDRLVYRQVALSVVPTKLKDNVKEAERLDKVVEEGLRMGKSAQEVGDDLIGFRIKEKSPFADTMRNYISRSELDQNEMANVSRLINNKDFVGAISLVENNLMEKVKNSNPDGYFGEAVATTAVRRANEIAKLYNELKEKNLLPVGVAKGTLQDALGRLKSREAQQLKTKITEAVADMRNQLSGTNVTESEQKFLEPKIPALSDSVDNFIVKLQQLQTEPLRKLNDVRSQFDLPRLNSNQLFNKTARVSLYGSTQIVNPITPPGKILVKDKKTGQQGFIEEKEFDANSYERQ